MESQGMESIAERLRRLRTKSGLSQAKLAQMAGVSQGTIGNIESGQRGYGESIVDIADALGVTPSYLRLDEKSEVLATTNRTDDANVVPGPSIKGVYPLISEVQAGAWTELCDNLQPGDAEDWLPSTKNLGDCGFMLRVTGKSMENPGGRFHFAEGMILHVNPDLDPQPNQFVVVRRESTKQATFKRYVMIDGEPYLEAINPDWPKDKKYLPLRPGDAWCGVVVDASYGGLL